MRYEMGIKITSWRSREISLRCPPLPVPVPDPNCVYVDGLVFCWGDFGGDGAVGSGPEVHWDAFWGGAGYGYVAAFVRVEGLAEGVWGPVGLAAGVVVWVDVAVCCLRGAGVLMGLYVGTEQMDGCMQEYKFKGW